MIEAMMKPGRALTLALLVAGAQPLAAAEPIKGRWITEARDAVVEIAPCGGQKWCGRIVKFLVPPETGPDARDVNNADPARRGRRIMGLAILTGFAPDGAIWRGQIYDPRRGRTFESTLDRKGAALNVQGCLGPFCQTQVWTRAK